MLACVFDLETSGFEANGNIILCACIKPFSGVGRSSITTFRADAYPAYRDNRADDRAISKAIYKELKKYDIWVAHNGVDFDDKFLRTRLSEAQIEMPRNKIIDPVWIARKNFRFGRNSLDQIASHFNVPGKNHVDMKYWKKAKFNHGAGETAAMNYIVEHCQRDVLVLESVFNKIKYLVPRIDKMGSYFA